MKVQRNKFNFDHFVNMSLRWGYLVPTIVQDILPGDSVRLKQKIFGRMSPPLAPIFGKIDIRTYHFFVPMRLIFDDTDEFFTRGRDFDSVVDMPQIRIENSYKSYFQPNMLPEYMGIPPIPTTQNVTGYHYFNALPFRAYQMIWNEFFRDPELQDEIPILTTSQDHYTTDLGSYVTFRRRNWDKDYFTSCKTQALLASDANGFVFLEDTTGGTDYYAQSANFYYQSGNPGQPPTTSGNLYVENGAGTASVSGQQVYLENLDPENIGVSVESIRYASAMQRWLEQIIRTGYRYKDYLLGIWNQKSSDSRLHRPEFLGGDSIPIRISEVLNMTDQSTNETPLGTMGGHGVAAGNGGYIDRQFEEHGYLISLVCVIPKPSYAQGVPAHYFKRDHLDYANPYLANLGMQETPVGELYYSWGVTQDTNKVNFGYKPRYSEYKTKNSWYAGEMRDTLSFWHLGREFGAAPTLNSDFIQCTPDQDIFAVQNEDQFYLTIDNEMSMLRKLPYYSTPKID